MDGLLLNLFLCLLVITGLILGGLYDVIAFYPAGGIYVLQFLEFCCSNTRQILNQIEKLE
jgi:hypothetical protein